MRRRKPTKRQRAARATGNLGEGMIVWKYPLKQLGLNVVTMPVGAKVLTAQLQHGSLAIWVLVEDDAAQGMQHNRQFKVVGTGNGAVEADDQYIATVQQGHFVWHVFEVTR